MLVHSVILLQLLALISSPVVLGMPAPQEGVAAGDPSAGHIDPSTGLWKPGLAPGSPGSTSSPEPGNAPIQGQNGTHQPKQPEHDLLALSQTEKPQGHGPFTGDMTYFEPTKMSAASGMPGSCGIFYKDEDPIIALSARYYDSVPNPGGNPNNHPLCGKALKISYGGKTINAKVGDKCPEGECLLYSIDLSPSLFAQLAPMEAGRLPVTWEWA